MNQFQPAEKEILQIPVLPNLGLSFIHRLTAAVESSFYEQKAKKSMAYKAETYHLNLINSHSIDYLSVFETKQKKKHSSRHLL